jgi:hopanoid biosynthesis associated protein HpnK
MKLAIINGDDFGFSSGVNQAIIEAHQRGILTSTSLMVTADAFSEAVKLAQENPNLGVGLHLVLCCGKPTLPPEKIPHLVDKNGCFPNDPAIAGLRYQFNPEARSQLKQEIKAQLEKFQATGLKLSHLDGHLHLHCHPVVLKILSELAREFRFKYIRLPSEELNFTLNIDSSNIFPKILWDGVFRQLRQYGEKLLSSQELHYLPRVYGLLQTGKITEAYLLGLIPQIEVNLCEIYAHPAFNIAGEPKNGPEDSGEQELHAFCSQKCKDMLRSKGFELINYLQLEEMYPE